MIERDVVIVGGGPAGLSTALHLQAHAPRLAERTVVLEGERYPREKICAGGVGGRAFPIFDRLGLQLDCPMVNLDAIALRIGGETIVTRERDLGVVVRRAQFDHALAKAAIARGLEVRDGCRVAAVRVLPDHAEVELEDGTLYRARAVVGADGVAGIVRRQTGFPRGELRAQVVELDTEAAPADLPRDTIVFDFTARDLAGYAWDFPTLVDGAPLVCRGVYVLHRHRRADALAGDPPRPRLAAYLAERGLDISRYRLKQYAEQGLEPGAPISRPRVLLVGEAAGIDIATGEGIAQAIEYGALAGPYLARALARDDLGFDGWRAHVDRHHLGVQLRVRHAGYKLFFGERRGTVERVLPQVRGLVEVGVQDFAGVPLSKLALLRGAGQLAWALAKMAGE